MDDDTRDDIGQVLVNYFQGDTDEDTTTAALLDIVAEAWDEGMRTGTSRAMRHMSDEPDLPLASADDNPYRDVRENALRAIAPDRYTPEDF